MPIKYLCGKCGCEMTEDEYDMNLSIVTECSDSNKTEQVIAEDLCADCFDFLIKLIKDTKISERVLRK